MDVEVSASSACVCRKVWGNTTLIPERTAVSHNLTSLSDAGCYTQDFSIRNENLKADIEVDVRVLF